MLAANAWYDNSSLRKPHMAAHVKTSLGGLHKCPACGAVTCVLETRVGGARLVSNSNILRRRRKCMACDHRFTTVEITLEDYAALSSNQSAVLRAALLRTRNTLQAGVRRLDFLLEAEDIANG